MDDSTMILERLMQLHPESIDLSLQRIKTLLERLNHPEERLPPVIHVAGTNGKGSTIAFLRALLEADGFHVHVYTSPHLGRFHERIRLGAEGGGQFVDEACLVEALTVCEKANQGDPITFFEITTAAAFLLFSEHPADYLLLETGLGGRLDATNVIDRPLASVITPVSFDHETFLGQTIDAIAAEKAGIFKKDVPAIIAPQSDEAQPILEDHAAKIGVPTFVGGKDWMVWEERGRLIYQDNQGLKDLPLPKLVGRHQIMNAGTAIATLRKIVPTIHEKAIAHGLPRVTWPGRLQRLSGEITALAPEEAEIWLDGGHNADGGRVVAVAMAELEERVSRPLVMIVGMLSSKAPEITLSSFQGLVSFVYTIKIEINEGQETSFEAKELAHFAEKAGLNAQPVDHLEAAFHAIKAMDWPIPPRILIYGSFYLVGYVLEKDGSLPF